MDNIEDAFEDQEFLPCPFCCGEAKEEAQRGTFEGYGITNVYCQKCGASVSDKETWNKRCIIIPPCTNFQYNKEATDG